MAMSLISAEAQTILNTKEFLQIFSYFENYFFFAIGTMACYDYLLTFDREIQFFWKAKQSVVSILFYGLRYSIFLNIILELLTRITWVSWQSNWSCAIVLRTQMAADIIVLVCGTVFAALRIYAIFNRNRSLFGLVLVSGLISPALSIYIFVRTWPELNGISVYKKSLPGIQANNYQVCALNIIGAHNTYEYAMMAARAASLLSDGLTLVLTGMKTFWSTYRGVHAETGLKDTIKSILLRDTVICFTLLCIVNIVGIATGQLAQFIDIWQVWTATLTSVLLSRLALDLREASAAEQGGSTEFFRRTYRTLDFASREDLDSSEFSAHKESDEEPGFSSVTTGSIQTDQPMHDGTSHSQQL